MKEDNNKKNLIILLVIYLAAVLLVVTIFSYYSKGFLNRENQRLQTEISTNSAIKANTLGAIIKHGADVTDTVASSPIVISYVTNSNAANIQLSVKQLGEQIIRDYLRSENIAIFDNSERVLFSQNLNEDFTAIYEAVKPYVGNDKYFSLVRINDETGYFVFVRSVVSANVKIGHIINFIKIDEEFFNIANFPPNNAYLNSEIAYINDGRILLLKPDSRTFKQEQELLIENDSIKQAGSLVEGLVDNQKYYALSKDIYEGKLYLIYKLDIKKGMSDAMNFHRNLIWLVVISLLLLGLLMFLLWRHYSVSRYNKISKKLDEKESYLELISDNQLQSMFLLSEDNRLVFANKSFFEHHNVIAEESIGKPLASVIGASMAESYIETASIDAADPIITTEEIYGRDGSYTYLQKKCLPVPTLDGKGTNHLFIEDDVTSLMKERKRYEVNLNSVIETIIRIIEQRSKYFYQHSQKLSSLSKKIAESMRVDNNTLRAVEIASKLSNLYIALLPREVINKEQTLSEEERKMLEEFPKKTIEIIEELEFNAPVIETLTQLGERPDGKGPLGLKESEIIESAKIIKVANDFVAMISDRPYRQRLSVEEALEILLKEKDKKYSSKVVFALANYMQNHAEI